MPVAYSLDKEGTEPDLVMPENSGGFIHLRRWYSMSMMEQNAIFKY